MSKQKWATASEKQRAAWAKSRERKSEYYAGINERTAQEQLGLDIISTWPIEEQANHWRALGHQRLSQLQNLVCQSLDQDVAAPMIKEIDDARFLINRATEPDNIIFVFGLTHMSISNRLKGDNL